MLNLELFFACPKRLASLPFNLAKLTSHLSKLGSQIAQVLFSKSVKSFFLCTCGWLVDMK